MSAQLLLELRQVCKQYGTTPQAPVIVRDVNLQMREREFVSLIGHSGCGKSTLLAMIAGLSNPTSGDLVLEGKRIQGPGPERAMVFQSPSLLPWLTARENVQLGIDQSMSGTSAGERRDIAEHYLQLLGIWSVKDTKPAHLSAGMRQRVGVARAFALKPRLLLLDEPFGSLDSITRFELQDVLAELCISTRTAALLVTHDVDEALYLSDRIAMMTDGPAATIGRILDVPMERATRREMLVDSVEFDGLRTQMMEFLEHSSSRRIAARTPDATLH